MAEPVASGVQAQPSSVDGETGLIGSTSAPSSSGSEELRVGQADTESCTPKFDALWFCYSPAYQIQQYYIHGRVDDCSSKWSEMIDCFKKRTKFKEEVLLAEAEKRHPLWEIRTHREAQDFWQQEFGHLSGQQRPRTEADGDAQYSDRPTLV